MVYGNLIFIKKTGGDGSKFPVTERDIKIGRSEGCLVRIYNSQVAPEHCQLIVGDNGQTTLRNLSNQTILNGKPLARGDVTLCHGDVFKLGERSVRWEYHPPSKNSKQLMSPSGRLVAVVMPQQRSLDDQATPGSKTSTLKNTPCGKRSHSERESSSSVKIRKSIGAGLSLGDISKFLTGWNVLKPSSIHAKGKERKSTPGMIRTVYSSKTPKQKTGGKSRKSTAPSWKVDVASPERKTPGRRKSIKQSLKSPKSAVKTPSKIADPKSSQKRLSKSGLKTPLNMKMNPKTSALLNLNSKTPLKSISEPPSHIGEAFVRSTRSFSKSPSPKKSPSKVVVKTPKLKPRKLSKIAQSESKLQSHSGRTKGTKRMSLNFKLLDSSPRQSLIKKLHESVPREKVKLSEEIKFDHSVIETIVLNTISPVKEKQTRKSVKRTPPNKSPGKTPRKSTLRKSVKSSAGVTVKTPRKSLIVKTPASLKKKKSSTPRISTSRNVAPDVIVRTPLLIDLECTPSPKRAKYTPPKSAKATPLKKTPGKQVKSVRKSKSPALASRKVSPIRRNESILSPSDIPDLNLFPTSTSTSSRKSSLKESPVTLAPNTSKSSVSSPRGVRRKLSPSSSAERAAKKLKTSCPKKPDKNKKAALLVLGKANRKHLPSQNVKVLLKQKIVKKAIKQSTAGTTQKVETSKKHVLKVKKVGRKPASKKTKEKKSIVKNSPQKESRMSEASTIKSPVKEKPQEEIPKNKTVVEAIQPSPSKVQISSRPSPKSKGPETPVNSPSKQNKKSESPRSIMSTKSFLSNVIGSPVHNYLFNSNRRSKRLSSKNDTGRPDFIELSPTALGLIPKNVAIFKTPKDTKRRSSSLVTPKSVPTTGIIKSASTSKIVNRKSVRFSSKGVSYNSEFHTPNTAEKVEFDFSSYRTPDVTVDRFVSPLTEKNSLTKKDMSESMVTSATGSNSKLSKPVRILGSNSEPKKCVRKLLQSPKARKTLHAILPIQKSLPRSSTNSSSKSPSPAKISNENKVPRNMKEVTGVRQPFKSVSSPKNSSPDLKGVRRLLRSPKCSKSPKNDLSDVKGVKKLFQTPKVQKIPKNDLGDVRGVKKLLQTPKVQKSPKNDLGDVRGVKKLLQTPKVRKSPKNDLTDLRGVKKLMRTPKLQKSPKNDLTDVRGVKKLLQTPKMRKSPKNDLTDLRGVKKLMRTPKLQKSPKNDLSDIKGVKALMRTPRAEKSPKNDLTNVDGVKQLLGSPRVQKSPKNDLTNVDGVKQLLGSPRVQKSPKNDLSDLTGVKKLFSSPRVQKSPKNNLLDVSGVKSLFTSPAGQKLSRNSAVKMLANSPQSGEDITKNAVNVTGVKQLLISKSPESASKSTTKSVTRKSHVKDYRAIRGRRTIYATAKGPKNDLSDVSGVRELFSRHKPISDYNINLTGVAELFDLPNAEVASKPKKERSGKKSTPAPARKSTTKKAVTTRRKIGGEKVERTVTRRGRPRKATEEGVPEETPEKTTKDIEVKKPSKRKAVEKVESIQVKKPPAAAKKLKKETVTSAKKSQAKTRAELAEDVGEVVHKGSRKRKVTFEEIETPPPKLRRKQPAAKKSESSIAEGTPRRLLSRPKKQVASEEKVSAQSSKKVAVTTKVNKTSKVQPKTAIKSGTKQIQKVQNRSQSSSKTKSPESKEKVSPRKTRSGKSAAVEETTQKKKVTKKQSKVNGTKAAKGTAGRSKVSPVVKKSTR